MQEFLGAELELQLKSLPVLKKPSDYGPVRGRIFQTQWRIRGLEACGISLFEFLGLLFHSTLVLFGYL
ncbi:hypothetical protein RHMOL_Rhmol10G0119200 [Rhododendron molle]|uniref:Uncharacterized protein n=1 Tax=Rhododendron molle TaxID=49168 RepID=A0ACC0M2E2_RHOML|nr:hypothetical protein RHMOL_Rhmol10G0119200 [Rhododendron molle]